MKKIGIIYGGKSVEHEVSIITGLQVYENLDKSKYTPELIYIDKDGDWFFGEKKLKDLKIYKNWTKKCAKQFQPSLNKKDKKNILNSLDAVIIACHGNYGEDGKLQSFLEFLDIPYTSSGVVGSASGMDKIVMKSIFSGIDLPVLPYIWFTRHDWIENSDEVIKKVRYTLDYPVFVKPANLGSSIGISMVNDEKDLINAIDVASKYDYRIIVEKGVANSVEINCSAIMKDNEVLTSVLEEPVRWEKFLSFDDKYINANSKTKGMGSMGRKIPAEVTKEQKEHIENYTKQIYKTMDCCGVVRVDYLMDESREHVYVNEINTIPGSFSFYLWEHNDLPFTKLIDVLIEEALRQAQLRKDKVLKYDSKILDNLTRNGKQGGCKR
ncbi:MAG: D-alanine--D-alanine ligase [Spirochaetales bacterium]|nr:D-alanine--D-alanine ligase [Spirochaetales bacterium]MBR2317137.1 D-alanine--D-alanine ligase [Spirochaetales bacterium]